MNKLIISLLIGFIGFTANASTGQCVYNHSYTLRSGITYSTVLPGTQYSVGTFIKAVSNYALSSSNSTYNTASSVLFNQVKLISDVVDREGTILYAAGVPYTTDIWNIDHFCLPKSITYMKYLCYSAAQGGLAYLMPGSSITAVIDTYIDGGFNHAIRMNVECNSYRQIEVTSLVISDPNSDRGVIYRWPKESSD